MQTFNVMQGNRIVGWVAAVNGDVAWSLARLVNPNATRLQPTL